MTHSNLGNIGYYSLVYHNSKVLSNITKVVTSMYSDKYGSKSVAKAIPAIECFIYNIVKAVKLSQSVISFSSDKSRYQNFILNGKKFNTGVGYSGTMNIVNMFIDWGAIDNEKGYKVETIFGVKAQSGYLLLNQIMIDFVELHVDLHLVKIGERKEVLVLRDNQSKDVEFKSSSYTEDNIKVLRQYNKFMVNNSLVQIDGKHLETGLARIFNIDFEHGGRLYTTSNSYQCVPASFRKRITINSNKTSEVDIKGSHISILNTLVGNVRLKGYDPYSIDMDGIADYDLQKLSFMLDCVDSSHNPFRNLVKVALLVMINADSKAKATVAIREKVDKQLSVTIDEAMEMEEGESENLTFFGIKNVNYQKLWKALEKKHEAIKQYFFSGAGMWLQKIEGDILLNVIAKCVEKNYPVLVIHDSCRAQDEHIREIGNFIEQAWEEVVGDTNNLQLEYEF